MQLFVGRREYNFIVLIFFLFNTIKLEKSIISFRNIIIAYKLVVLEKKNHIFLYGVG